MDLRGMDLRGATLDGVKSGNLKYRIGFTPLPPYWQLINGYLIGPGANLTGAHLLQTGATLTGNLTGADLNLRGATLDAVKSGGITGDAFTLASNWQLIDGYLIGPGADLTDADLSGADLIGADLRGATLDGVKSGGITGDGSTTLPTNWQLIDGYLIGPGADLTDADLSGVDLSGVDLSGADLTNATLTNVKSGGTTGDGSNIAYQLATH